MCSFLSTRLLLREFKHLSPSSNVRLPAQGCHIVCNYFIPLFNVYDYYAALCICFAIMRRVHDPRTAVLHIWVALIVPRCVHVCLRFAVGVGSSGVCMFRVLILVFILALNCEAL